MAEVSQGQPTALALLNVVAATDAPELSDVSRQRGQAMTEVKTKTVEHGDTTKPICPKCKSDQVVRDAWAEWCSATGGWVLRTTFDHFICDACGEDISEPKWIDLSKTGIIRLQNDRFRKGDHAIPGRHLLTSGIQELAQTSGAELSDVIETVAAFDVFTEDNDPHKEHDFGQFTYRSKNCFWKIDYYNIDLSGGSEDPSDLSRTHRVLTIMLAEEY